MAATPLTWKASAKITAAAEAKPPLLACIRTLKLHALSADANTLAVFGQSIIGPWAGASPFDDLPTDDWVDALTAAVLADRRSLFSANGVYDTHRTALSECTLAAAHMSASLSLKSSSGNAVPCSVEAIGKFWHVIAPRLWGKMWPGLIISMCHTAGQAASLLSSADVHFVLGPDITTTSQTLGSKPKRNAIPEPGGWIRVIVDCLHFVPLSVGQVAPAFRCATVRSALGLSATMSLRSLSDPKTGKKGFHSWAQLARIPPPPPATFPVWVSDAVRGAGCFVGTPALGSLLEQCARAALCKHGQAHLL